ncbi:hypothetical protein GE09DRAFT_311023 [Coniochaeta sp. 2T2.1]|nr:hypothetical protein GE09DRAFT_311023 [Coniochaeta sp. 2T2.1]
MSGTRQQYEHVYPFFTRSYGSAARRTPMNFFTSAPVQTRLSLERVFAFFRGNSTRTRHPTQRHNHQHNHQQNYQHNHQHTRQHTCHCSYQDTHHRTHHPHRSSPFAIATHHQRQHCSTRSSHLLSIVDKARLLSSLRLLLSRSGIRASYYSDTILSESSPLQVENKPRYRHIATTFRVLPTLPVYIPPQVDSSRRTPAMCIVRQFIAFACSHDALRLERCSRPTVCRVATRSLLAHPGECPDCLGDNIWPPGAYTPQRHHDPERIWEMTGYAQSLLNFITLWLAGSFHKHDKEGDGMLLSDSERAIHVRSMRRLYYLEIPCVLCDGLAPVYTKNCSSCDRLEDTANTTRRIRTSHIRELCVLGYFEDIFDLPRTHVQWEIQQLKSAGFPKQYGTGMPLINPAWPFDSASAEKRHDSTIPDIRRYMDEIPGIQPSTDIDKMPNEAQTYKDVGRQVLGVAARLMSYDTGLTTRDTATVISHLAPILQHPSDQAKYSWSTVLFFQDYRRVMLAWCRCIRSPADSVRRMGQLLHGDLANTQAHQQEAMNLRRSALISARLEHYTLPISSVPTDWICAICRQGSENTGRISKLQACDHTYHFDCMVFWAAAGERGNTTCPLCRRTFDSLEQGDWQIDLMEQHD